MTAKRDYVRECQQALKFRVQKLRRDAEILLAKAEELEGAQTDLELAIDKAAGEDS